MEKQSELKADSDVGELLCEQCRTAWKLASTEQEFCAACDAVMKQVRAAALERGFRLGI